MVGLDTLIVDIRGRRRELLVLLLRFRFRLAHLDHPLRVFRQPMRRPDHRFFIALRVPGLPGRRHNCHRLSGQCRQCGLPAGWIDAYCPVEQFLCAFLNSLDGAPCMSLSWQSVDISSATGIHGPLVRELQYLSIVRVSGIELLQLWWLGGVSRLAMRLKLAEQRSGLVWRGSLRTLTRDVRGWATSPARHRGRRAHSWVCQARRDVHVLRQTGWWVSVWWNICPCVVALLLIVLRGSACLRGYADFLIRRGQRCEDRYGWVG